MSTTMAEPAELARLEAVRLDAIEDSGLSMRFHVFQPRNLAFWVWSFLSVCGLLALLDEVTGKLPYYGLAIGLSTTLFVLFGALLWWFTRGIDRYTPLPTGLAIVGFVWGGLVAPWLLARAANDATMALYSKFFGPQWAQYWGTGASVWFNEEVAKGLGVVLLIALAPRIMTTAFDGFIAGAYTGLGFQVIESIVYGQRSTDAGFAMDQLGATLNVALMRMATGLGGHIWFTAVFGAGLVYVLGRPREPRRPARGLLLMGGAMLVHFVWDSQSAIAAAAGINGVGGILTVILFPGMPIASILLAALAFRLTVPNERAVVAPLLAPEVAQGVVLAEEVMAAAGTAKDRRRYVGRGPGRSQRRAVLNGVFELIHELARWTGRRSERLEFIRGELAHTRSSVTNERGPGD